MLSTDMVGFTEVSQTLGNEDAFALLQDVLGIARASIEYHGGTVVDTAGDGLLAAFGAPRSLENASAQCCKAAFAFHSELQTQAPTFVTRYNLKPQFRTGIAGGATMIAHGPDATFKAVGTAVNLASRLCAMANPSVILIDETVRVEAEGDIDITTQEPAKIKGFDGAVTLHRLTGVPERQSRFESALQRGVVDFMSRDAEIASAINALQPSDGSTRPKIVLISGVPGVGKSRLTHEIIGKLAQHGPAYVGQCVSRGTAPALAPIHDILSQAGVTQATQPTPGDVQSDAYGAAHQARNVARDQLHELHALKRALVVIEDAHWIDKATNDLIATIAKDPIPMIVTCRPTFDALWARTDTVLRIDLKALQHADIQRIVESHLLRPVSPHLADLIWSKSEGIPLVAEEIARALMQKKNLIAGAHGLDLSDGDSLAVTGNLEQMVMGRVDVLPAAEKTALQVASAIGRRFSQSLLSQVLGQPCDATLIQRMGGLIEPAGPNVWRFSHALVQDAVYGSQLKAQKQAIHLKIAQALEASIDGDANTTSMLAAHYVKACVPYKAVQYLLKSAHENLALYALPQVDEDMEQAMSFIAADQGLVDDVTLADLAVVWLRALDQSGDFARLLQASARLLPLLDRTPYSPHRSIAKTLTAIAMAHARAYTKGEDLAQATLAEAETQGDDWGAAWAKVALMRIYEETNWKTPDAVEKMAAEIAPVAQATQDHHLEMTARYMLSSLYRSTGRRIQALEIATELSTFAETHNDLRARSYALWAQSLVYSIEGNPEAALETIAPGQKDAIEGTADAYVFELISLYAQAFLVPNDDIQPKFAAFRDRSIRYADFNLVHAVTWVMTLSQFMAGRLATGWQTLDQLIADSKIAGNMNMQRQAIMLRAETQLSICGLIDPAAEAPAGRPTLPRDKPKLADLKVFALIRVFGLRRAAADYLDLIAVDPLKRGNIYARAHIGLGLIAMRRRQTAKAAAYLQEGLAQARNEGLDQLAKRAEKALGKLPAST